MPPRTILIDGWDAGQAGVVVTDGLRGKLDGPEARYPSVAVPGRISTVRLTSEPVYQTTTLRVPILVEADTRAVMLSRLDELKWRLAGRDLRVTFVDDETREFRALQAALEAQSTPPDLSQRAVEMRLLLEMKDPRVYDTTDTAVALSTSPAATPLGTAPVGPVVRIDGGVTDPTVTYRDNGGTVVETMGLTVALAGGQWVEVDMEAQTIEREDGTPHPEYLTSGTFFRLDPRDGDYPGSSWPTLELSGSTGTATYRRAWW